MGKKVTFSPSLVRGGRIESAKLHGNELYPILWRKQTMHPENIHFPLSTLGPVHIGLA